MLSTMSAWVGVIMGILGLVTLLAGAFLVVKSQIPKETIKQYKELSDGQSKRIDSLEAQAEEDRKRHIENSKAIADLGGQVKILKDIPLQSIAASLQEIKSLISGGQA